MTVQPERSALERVLAEHAPLSPVPLCPELRVPFATSLTGIWSAAEALVGATLPAPFWAYPWAGGCALARVLLDRPELVRGRTVLDFGAGGGVASIAAAKAGASRVTANDIDPWALLVASIAADANGVALDTLEADLCADPAAVAGWHTVLCSDLAYERSQAPRQRTVLEHALRAGAVVLVADAGRTYFDPTGLELLAVYDVPVPVDLEGTDRRTAWVYRTCF